MANITIEFFNGPIENHIPFGDYEIMDRVDNWINDAMSRDIHIKTNQELVILAFRSNIASGRISPSCIVVVYEGNEVEFTEYGRFLDQPDGMCNLQFELIHQMLIDSMKE